MKNKLFKDIYDEEFIMLLSGKYILKNNFEEK
jgi:hypothetical protein